MALLVALLVVFLVSVVLGLVALSLAVRMRLARDEARAVTLNALCDAALAEALAEIANGPGAGVPEHPFGAGTIGAEIEPIGSGDYLVTATARFDTRTRTALATVVRDAAGTRVVRWRRSP